MTRLVSFTNDRRGRVGRWFSYVGWGHLGLLVAVCGTLWWVGDAWAPTVLLVFGPRWIFALPLVPLLAAHLVLCRRFPWAHFVAGLIVVGPLMGFNVPFRSLFLWNNPAADSRLRVLSCNVAAPGRDISRLGPYIAKVDPDVIALQESRWTRRSRDPVLQQWKTFPWPPDYHVWQVRGLTIASRYPILDVETGWFPGLCLMKCRLQTPRGDVTLVNVHLPTPREGIEPTLHQGWSGGRPLRRTVNKRNDRSRRTAEWVSRLDGPVVVAGDFNLTADSRIYRDHWSPLQNAFCTSGFGFGYTKWTRWFGARIDHILVNDAFEVQRAWVGPHVGSDHRPIVADLTLRSDRPAP